MYAGNTATFYVAGYGQLDLTYYWRKNGTVFWVQTNNPGINITNLSTSDAGTYDVIVSNALGTVTSTAQALTVQNISPQITAEPLSASRPQHGKYVLDTALWGTWPISLQWKLNGTNYPNGNTAVLSLTNIALSDAGTWVFYATNSLGWTNSVPVTLTVSRDLALNPLFGDGGGSVTNASMANWSDDYGGGGAVIDPTLGFGTWGTWCGLGIASTRMWAQHSLPILIIFLQQLCMIHSMRVMVVVTL